MDGKGKRVQSVEKAMLLLDCFWRARKSFSLAELAAQTGWAKSTIHALLSSMTGSALVEQDPQTGKYQLGYHAFELGCVVLERWPVRRWRGTICRRLPSAPGVSLPRHALRQRAAAGREHGGIRQLPAGLPPGRADAALRLLPGQDPAGPICRRSSGQSFLRPSP